MPDENNRSLISLPDASLALARPKSGRVLSELVGDTLALALGKPLRKIGEYEWCEPDYRQILLWAEALGLEPEEVIRRLLDRRTLHMPERDRTVFQETVFENGRIVKLNWDLNLLPISNFEWIEGLEIDYLRLAFWQYDESARVPLKVSLPKLRELNCECATTELDLSGVPSLEKLWCSGKGLTSLQLSKLPRLKELQCKFSQISELDLSKLPTLTVLNCQANQLAVIDLSQVPLLRACYALC